MSVVWQALWFIVAVSCSSRCTSSATTGSRAAWLQRLRFSVGFGKPLLSRVAGPIAPNMSSPPSRWAAM